MPISSQNDIVEQYMMNQDAGKEVKDKVRVPGLAELFIKPPASQKNKIKTEIQKILGLTLLHTKAKDEVANVFITQALERRGIVSFSWEIGKDQLHLSVIDNYAQTPIDEPRRELITKILVNVMKSRKSVTAIKWDLGSDFIEISYIA